MSCDAYWQEFQRLDRAVRLVRTDDRTRALTHAELVSVLGVSNRLVRPFGGHAMFASTAGGLFGLLWAVGLWSELGYAYDRFSTQLWILSLPVFVYVCGALLASLMLDVRVTRAGASKGLARASTLLLGSLIALAAALVVVLPQQATIAASFTTRTAAVGY